MTAPPSDRRLTAGIRDAYEDAVLGWAAGPTVVYRRLAQALIGGSDRSLAGCRALDLGAGTGVASEVLIEAGARPVAVDLAGAMLQHQRSSRPPATVGDARALPFRAGSFDAVVAAFCLNHLPDPVAGLAECRRVLRPGGALLASTFPVGADHPAKVIVEAVLERFGYQRPAWYADLKGSVAARTGGPDGLARAATVAGLSDVDVSCSDVEVGLDRPELAVEWRLNMPHTTGFVASLAPEARAELRSRATTSLMSRAGDLPSSLAMLALRASA